MPYVSLQLTKDGLTREKKAEIVRRITELLVDVLDKRPDLPT